MTEYMQVPVLVNICPVSLKKVLAYVLSLTAVPEYKGKKKKKKTATYVQGFNY